MEFGAARPVRRRSRRRDAGCMAVPVSVGGRSAALRRRSNGALRGGFTEAVALGAMPTHRGEAVMNGAPGVESL